MDKQKKKRGSLDSMSAMSFMNSTITKRTPASSTKDRSILDKKNQYSDVSLDKGTATVLGVENNAVMVENSIVENSSLKPLENFDDTISTVPETQRSPKSPKFPTSNTFKKPGLPIAVERPGLPNAVERPDAPLSVASYVDFESQLGVEFTSTQCSQSSHSQSLISRRKKDKRNVFHNLSLSRKKQRRPESMDADFDQKIYMSDEESPNLDATFLSGRFLETPCVDSQLPVKGKKSKKEKCRLVPEMDSILPTQIDPEFIRTLHLIDAKVETRSKGIEANAISDEQGEEISPNRSVADELSPCNSTTVTDLEDDSHSRRRRRKKRKAKNQVELDVQNCISLDSQFLKTPDFEPMPVEIAAVENELDSIIVQESIAGSQQSPGDPSESCNSIPKKKRKKSRKEERTHTSSESTLLPHEETVRSSKVFADISAPRNPGNVHHSRGSENVLVREAVPSRNGGNNSTSFTVSVQRKRDQSDSPERTITQSEKVINAGEQCDVFKKRKKSKRRKSVSKTDAEVADGEFSSISEVFDSPERTRWTITPSKKEINAGKECDVSIKKRKKRKRRKSSSKTDGEIADGEFSSLSDAFEYPVIAKKRKKTNAKFRDLMPVFSTSAAEYIQDRVIVDNDCDIEKTRVGNELVSKELNSTGKTATENLEEKRDDRDRVSSTIGKEKIHIGPNAVNEELQDVASSRKVHDLMAAFSQRVVRNLPKTNEENGVEKEIVPRVLEKIPLRDDNDSDGLFLAKSSRFYIKRKGAKTSSSGARKETELQNWKTEVRNDSSCFSWPKSYSSEMEVAKSPTDRRSKRKPSGLPACSPEPDPRGSVHDNDDSVKVSDVKKPSLEKKRKSGKKNSPGKTTGGNTEEKEDVDKCVSSTIGKKKSRIDQKSTVTNDQCISSPESSASEMEVAKSPTDRRSKRKRSESAISSLEPRLGEETNETIRKSVENAAKSSVRSPRASAANSLVSRRSPRASLSENGEQNMEQNHDKDSELDENSDVIFSSAELENRSLKRKRTSASSHVEMGTAAVQDKVRDLMWAFLPKPSTKAAKSPSKSPTKAASQSLPEHTVDVIRKKRIEYFDQGSSKRIVSNSNSANSSQVQAPSSEITSSINVKSMNGTKLKQLIVSVPRIDDTRNSTSEREKSIERSEKQSNRLQVTPKRKHSNSSASSDSSEDLPPPKAERRFFRIKLQDNIALSKYSLENEIPGPTTSRNEENKSTRTKIKTEVAENETSSGTRASKAGTSRLIGRSSNQDRSDTPYEKFLHAYPHSDQQCSRRYSRVPLQPSIEVSGIQSLRPAVRRTTMPPDLDDTTLHCRFTPDEDLVLRRNWEKFARTVSTVVDEPRMLLFRSTKPNAMEMQLINDYNLYDSLTVGLVGLKTRYQCYQRLKILLEAENTSLQNGGLSAEEHKKLVDLIGQLGHDWKEIGRRMNRTSRSVKNHYRRMYDKRDSRNGVGFWQKEEDDDLLKCIRTVTKVPDLKELTTEQLRKIDWKLVSAEHKSRSRDQCWCRWNRSLYFSVNGLRRRNLTHEETWFLLNQLEELNAVHFSEIPWSQLAEEYPSDIQPLCLKDRAIALRRHVPGARDLSWTQCLRAMRQNYKPGRKGPKPGTIHSV